MVSSRLGVGLLHKVLDLTPAERRFLIIAWLWLGFFRVALWLLPFQRVNRLMERMSRNMGGRPGVHPKAAGQIAAAIRRASRLVPQATCLPQALAALAMLKRLGLPAELHIGVAKDEAGRFQAHAWVGSAGSSVVGGSSTQYQTLWTLDNYEK